MAPTSPAIWHRGFVLIDKHGNVIQAKVPNNIYQRLVNVIMEGRVCEIGPFSMVDAPAKYRTVPGNKMISFTRQTVVTPLSAPDLQIPRYYFRIARLQDVGTEIKDPNDVIDIVGRIAGFSPIKHIGQDNRPIRYMYLADERLYIYACKPYSASKFYFDKEIPEIAQFVASLPQALPPIVLDTNGPPYDGVPANNQIVQDQQVEPEKVTVSEFLAVEVDPYSYHIVATIADLDNRYEWFYEACKKCAKRIQDLDTVPWCPKCKVHRNDFIYWYRLELKIQDPTGTAKINALGRVAAVITGKEASTLAKKNGKIQYEAPAELLTIIGKTFAFTVLPKESAKYPGLRQNTVTRAEPVQPDQTPLLTLEPHQRVPEENPVSPSATQGELSDAAENPEEPKRSVRRRLFIDYSTENDNSESSAAPPQHSPDKAPQTSQPLEHKETPPLPNRHGAAAAQHRTSAMMSVCYAGDMIYHTASS
ncbi:DNA binding protein-like [Rhynchospora pubera]|uniref:DNA binding protein-like n=1 Tax=Rhynchospora pubera TaxID=906938 RepID=A0AAV8GUQ4_9POAL|nr:DNA binding protein-like [Rhynchospora pubera]